jgi:glutaconate CoA-transferase subunit A
MVERAEKLCSLKDAVGLIEDGMRIGFGGFTVYQRPMAVAHEIIRAGKKNLTIVGCNDSIDVDMLIGAGCVSRVETSYVGLEKFGLARNFRRTMEAGKLKMVYYPEMLSCDRFRANRSGMPFWPVDFLGGNDVANRNQEIVPFKCPVTGKQLWAVPAANIDVAIIHAHIADKYGNVQIQDRYILPQSTNETVAHACSTIIATAEHIVDNEVIRENPHLTMVPAFKTTCVAEARYGSHPTPTLYETRTDEIFFNEYVKASETESTFKEFLDKYIYGVNTFDEYIALVGRKQLEALEER